MPDDRKVVDVDRRTPAGLHPVPFAMKLSSPRARPRRILLLGATGTIGRAVLAELSRRDQEVICALRPGRAQAVVLPPGAVGREAELADPQALARDVLRGERIDAVVSCLASRTGAPQDAWAIDHRVHQQALASGRAAGATRFVQLSAICVQKPRLAFQHAKLAFEGELQASDLAWTIVRPTAYFKSLSGQIERVKRGRPFLVFGDGQLTACKPIADEDLALYLADCLDDPATERRVLPIGGPGAAITPVEQARMLFERLGRPLHVRRVPVGLISGIAGVAALCARLAPLEAVRARAEFARIGQYYATESMLVWDPVAGRYDAEATPSFGTRTLDAHYAAVLCGERTADLGEHAVF